MIADNIRTIKDAIGDAKLVVVSKFRTLDELKEVYDSGHLDMGENRVQQLLERYEALPKDIRWHMIGHLQTNKVKYIAPFVALIHSVDSLKLLKEINKQGANNNRVIPVLLQMHIADEDSKFGLSKEGLMDLVEHVSREKEIYRNIDLHGLMGMASFTENEAQVSGEFRSLRQTFDEIGHKIGSNWPNFRILSMGMSGDYRVAILEGSNLVRIGTAIFSTN